MRPGFVGYVDRAGVCGICGSGFVGYVDEAGVCGICG